VQFGCYQRVDADLGGEHDAGRQGRGQRNLAADVEPEAEVPPSGATSSDCGKPSQLRPGALQGDTMPPPVGEEVKHEGGLPEHQPVGVDFEGGSGPGDGVGLRALGDRDVQDSPGDPPAAASASTPAYGEAEKLRREADQEKQEVEKQMAEASEAVEKLQRKLDENQKKAARAHKLADCEAAKKEAVNERVRVNAAAAAAHSRARDELDVANKEVNDASKAQKQAVANERAARDALDVANKVVIDSSKAQKQAVAKERAALKDIHTTGVAAAKIVDEKQREWDDARRA